MEIRIFSRIFAKAKKVFNNNQIEIVTSLIDAKVDNSMNEVLTEIRNMRAEMERRFQALYWVIGLLATLVVAILTLVVAK